MRKYLLIGVAALALSIIGCNRVAPLSSATRSPKVGDTASYDIVNAKGQNVGSFTVIVETASIKPKVAKNLKGIYQLAGSTSFTVPGRPVFTAKAYELYGWDAFGNQYYLGKSRDARKWDLIQGKSLALDTPGTFTNNKSWKYSVRLKSGEVQTLENKVIGVEEVTTPKGRFQAYKISFARSSKSSTESGVRWIAPQMGLPVMTAATTTLQMAGSTMNLQRTETLHDCNLVK